MEWKNIPILNGFYDASKCGKIRRREHFVIRVSKFGTPIKHTLREKILNGKGINNKGYPVMGIGNKSFLTHRLIASAWIGDGNNLQVNHINGIKTDNRVENLEYCSNMANRKHAIENNLISKRNKGTHGLSMFDCFKICQMYLIDKKSSEDIKTHFKVCRKTIGNIVNTYADSFLVFWNT